MLKKRGHPCAGVLTLDWMKHGGPTAADDVAPWSLPWNVTLDLKQLGFCASLHFLQTLGPRFPNETLKTSLHLNRRPPSNGPVLFLLNPGDTSLTLFLVQEWFDARNVTLVASFLDTSVCGGSWRTDSSLSPLLVKLPRVLEWALLDSPLKAVVISVACAPFPATLFPSSQLPMIVCWYSALWTAGTFSNVGLCPPHGGCHWVTSRQLSSQQSFHCYRSSSKECVCVSFPDKKYQTFPWYSNILTCWIFDFHELWAIVLEMKTKKGLEIFHCV